MEKTDIVDFILLARALPAEPSLGLVQTLEVCDSLVAKIETVLEHRRALVETRTLMLHYDQDQIAKQSADVRDQLSTKGDLSPG